MNTPLKDYWDMLNRHDWYWHMADGIRETREGKAKEAELLKISEESIEHKKMYVSFEAFNFTGDPWNSERTIKPERPT